MLADKARKAGVPVFFDPNLRPQLWPCRDSMVAEVNALAALADYVMPGVGEGEILCGSKDPGEIGRFYMERGARAVIVKTGANGAETFTRAGSFRPWRTGWKRS
ncbi:MAG: carbohydrate kinase family protein [Flavonifractor plautii]